MFPVLASESITAFCNWCGQSVIDHVKGRVPVPPKEAPRHSPASAVQCLIVGREDVLLSYEWKAVSRHYPWGGLWNHEFMFMISQSTKYLHGLRSNGCSRDVLNARKLLSQAADGRPLGVFQ